MAIKATTTRDLRKNFKKFADDVSDYGDVVLVTRPEKKNVVLLSEKEYNSWQETNYLLSTKANREALAKGMDDKRGSALDRAKKLLSVSDWANSPKEISRATGVKYQALLNYRQDLDKLDKASWNTINELSQLYDIYQIQKSLPYQDMLEVQNQVHKMMNELRDNHDGTTENILIDQMERIITSDPNAIYKIYRRLHKQ